MIKKHKKLLPSPCCCRCCWWWLLSDGDKLIKGHATTFFFNIYEVYIYTLIFCVRWYTSIIEGVFFVLFLPSSLSHLVVLYDDELLLGRGTGEHDLGVLQDGVPLLLLHVGRDFPSGNDNRLGVLGVFEVSVSC